MPPPFKTVMRLEKLNAFIPRRPPLNPGPLEPGQTSCPTCGITHSRYKTREWMARVRRGGEDLRALAYDQRCFKCWREGERKISAALEGWRQRAPRADLPPVFITENGLCLEANPQRTKADFSAGGPEAGFKEAAATCMSCVDRVECLLWALDAPETSVRATYGGYDWRERAQMAVRRKRAKYRIKKAA